MLLNVAVTPLSPEWLALERSRAGCRRQPPIGRARHKSRSRGKEEEKSRGGCVSSAFSLSPDGHVTPGYPAEALVSGASSRRYRTHAITAGAEIKALERQKKKKRYLRAIKLPNRKAETSWFSVIVLTSILFSHFANLLLTNASQCTLADPQCKRIMIVFFHTCSHRWTKKENWGFPSTAARKDGRAELTEALRIRAHDFVLSGFICH